MAKRDEEAEDGPVVRTFAMGMGNLTLGEASKLTERDVLRRFHQVRAGRNWRFVAFHGLFVRVEKPKR
jgi:hypothetical protein